MNVLSQNNVSLPLLKILTERIGMNKEEKKPQVPPCSYTDEEMYKIVKERLQNLEDGSAILVDGEEVLSQIRARYGFKV